MSEVPRFPGIGFSLCAAPTFSRVQGILNRGYELSFRNALEQGKCTGMIPSMSAKMREVGVQSWYGSEVHGMCEIELALSEELSRERWI